MQKKCNRCILDDSIPGITFDKNGICSYCYEHDNNEKLFPVSHNVFQSTINKIKKSKKGKYDCVLGLSGGCDSSYLLHLAIENSLNPLVVSFDNGWDSQTAKNNVRKLVEKLKIDHISIKPHSIFHCVQKAFLFASVPDIEVPTDMAIKTTLYEIATKNKIKYILSGANFRTEGRIPRAWSFVDHRYIKDVYKNYYNKSLKSFPSMSLWKIFYYSYIKRIEGIKLLNYVDYIKNDVKELLRKKYDWEDYGGKHYESEYTKFVSAYWFPVKFGIDKRIIEYSALIRSGQLKRNEALKLMKESPTEYCDDVNIGMIFDILNITKEQSQIIIAKKNKSYKDFKNYKQITDKLRPVINVLQKIKPRI